MPGPVGHVGQEHLTGRRRNHLPRHRARNIPHLEVDDGPDDDAAVAGSFSGGRSTMAENVWRCVGIMGSVIFYSELGGLRLHEGQRLLRGHDVAEGGAQAKKGGGMVLGRVHRVHAILDNDDRIIADVRGAGRGEHA